LLAVLAGWSRFQMLWQLAEVAPHPQRQRLACQAAPSAAHARWRKLVRAAALERGSPGTFWAEEERRERL